jgi:hypothetical protein
VTAAGLNAILEDVEQLVEELVANATSHTQALLELTIDAHDDVVRVEVHDQPSRVVLGLEEHPAGRSGARGPGATGHPNRWDAEPLRGWGKVVWAEVHGGEGS